MRMILKFKQSTALTCSSIGNYETQEFERKYAHEASYDKDKMWLLTKGQFFLYTPFNSCTFPYIYSYCKMWLRYYQNIEKHRRARLSFPYQARFKIISHLISTSSKIQEFIKSTLNYFPLLILKTNLSIGWEWWGLTYV